MGCLSRFFCGKLLDADLECAAGLMRGAVLGVCGKRMARHGKFRPPSRFEALSQVADSPLFSAYTTGYFVTARRANTSHIQASQDEHRADQRILSALCAWRR
jgi:hypothetical protein